MNTIAKSSSFTPDRRAFLTASGALFVTLAAPERWSAVQAEETLAANATLGTATRPAMDFDQLDSYLAIKPDGRVTVFYGKIDGGQGLETSIAQMVAEELEVAYETVDMVMGDTALTLDMGGASGATGVSRGGMVLGQTAAEARVILVAAASRKLGVPVDDLAVEDGVVFAKADSAKRISYAELISGRFFDTKVKWNGKTGSAIDVAPERAKLKKPELRKVIGQSFRRKDLEKKVFGTLDYVSDVKIPGMLHARMIRPVIAGAVPVSVDESSIKDIPGAQVVRVKDLIAVVAPKEWNAIRAAKALKVSWSQSSPNFPGHDGQHDHIRNAKVTLRKIERENGSVDDGFKAAARIVEGQYEYPTHSHATTGPACAVADFRDGKCTIWTSTQKPHDAAAGVADLLKLPEENVHAVWVWGTGSYGRNDQGDATADAAVLSHALGKPVRVQYMRHEGLAWDPKGTASVNFGRAGLDADGKVIAYELISRGFSRENTATRENRASGTLAGQLLGVKLEPKDTFNIPFASYTFDHNRVGWETVAPLMDRASPLRTTHLRDPYGPPILFGSESFMDEVAQASGMDPVAFRLRYLKHPRDAAAVKIAAKKSGWQPRVGPRTDQKDSEIAVGRGIAFRRHFDTFIALVAEVRVHRKTGEIEPVRYVCAHDCGMIVNPETLRHVVERQLVYGTSRTMFEEVTFDSNMVTSADWESYPVLHIEAAPKEIDIVLIDRPEAAPSGAAEMALGLVPAAIGNAVFDATGVRLRRIPFTPARVKAELDRA